MPRGLRRTNKRSKRVVGKRIGKRSIKRTRIKDNIINVEGGRNDMVVVEKNDIVKNNITYSTSHTLNREVNQKNIQNLFQRYSKSMKKLAE